jgi:hypothetical protein
MKSVPDFIYSFNEHKSQMSCPRRRASTLYQYVRILAFAGPACCCNTLTDNKLVLNRRVAPPSESASLGVDLLSSGWHAQVLLSMVLSELRRRVPDAYPATPKRFAAVRAMNLALRTHNALNPIGLRSKCRFATILWEDEKHKILCGRRKISPSRSDSE